MITATILTKNSQKHICEVLDALSFCNEVIILDSGSTDETLKLASNYKNTNIHIHKGEFLGFGKMHQKASALAKNDWILSIDSDEIVSSMLKDEILSIKLSNDTVYYLPSDNYFCGKHITTCGWSPDFKARIYNKRFTDFDDKAVHENIKLDGMKKEHPKHSIIHYSYNEVSDFLNKMQNYSTLFAKENVGKKSSSVLKAVTHGLWAFTKSYLIKMGFTQGYEGFIISVYNGHTAFWKYIKLYEANRRTTLQGT